MDHSELVERWKIRAERTQLAHYEASRRNSARHYFLGIPAIVLSTVVGTTVFASLSKNPDLRLQIAMGLLSVMSAVLVSLQTFLKNAEHSEKHRLAGAKYASLRHQLEILQTMPPASQKEIKEKLNDIEMQWSKFRDDSPTLSTKVWKSIEKEEKSRLGFMSAAAMAIRLTEAPAAADMGHV